MAVSAIRALVFARAPVPGACKTRLIPALGAEGAAALQERLIRRTVATVCAVAGLATELCVTPDSGHAVFGELAACHGIACTAQGEGDLGQRMARAARRVIDAGQAVLLLGTDCPGYDADYLAQARDMLAAGNDVVLGPAHDGGYVLLGLRRFHASLFEDIDWGSDRVLAQTRQGIAALGWQTTMLPTLHDIDRPEDLVRFPALSE